MVRTTSGPRQRLSIVWERRWRRRWSRKNRNCLRMCTVLAYGVRRRPFFLLPLALLRSHFGRRTQQIVFGDSRTIAEYKKKDWITQHKYMRLYIFARDKDYGPRPLYRTNTNTNKQTPDQTDKMLLRPAFDVWFGCIFSALACLLLGLVSNIPIYFELIEIMGTECESYSNFYCKCGRHSIKYEFHIKHEDE